MACASVEYIFGERIGDPTADRILHFLAEAGGLLTRSEIRKRLSNHIKNPDLNSAVELLADSHRVLRETKETGGRPAEIVRLAPQAQKAQQRLPGVAGGHGLVAHCELCERRGAGG